MTDPTIPPPPGRPTDPSQLGIRRLAAVLGIAVALLGGFALGALIMQWRPTSSPSLPSASTAVVPSAGLSGAPSIAASAAASAVASAGASAAASAGETVAPSAGGEASPVTGLVSRDASGVRCGADYCVVLLTGSAAERVGAPAVRLWPNGWLTPVPVPDKRAPGPLFISAAGALSTKVNGVSKPVVLPAGGYGFDANVFHAYAVACDGNECLVAFTYSGATKGEGLMRWQPGKDWETVAGAPGTGIAPASGADRLGLLHKMIIWMPGGADIRYSPESADFYGMLFD